MKSTKEFRKFDKTMKALIAVKHQDIKVRLDAEKVAKQKKRKPKKASAGGHVSGDKG